MKIRLDARLSQELERLAKEKGVSKGEYARDALRCFIGVIRFRELQAKTIKHVEALGIRVDDVSQ